MCFVVLLAVRCPSADRKSHQTGLARVPLLHCRAFQIGTIAYCPQAEGVLCPRLLHTICKSILPAVPSFVQTETIATLSDLVRLCRLSLGGTGALRKTSLTVSSSTYMATRPATPGYVSQLKYVHCMRPCTLLR